MPSRVPLLEPQPVALWFNWNTTVSTATCGAPIAATNGTFDVTIPTTGSGIIEIT